MPFPPSKIQNPNIKQYRKNSTSNHKNPISPSKSQPEIKPRLLWAFDSPRKDSKRQARLRCTKFFYTLDIKLCNKEYRYLRCLKSDKVCCRHLIMKMDKPFLYTRDFPVRRHHIKLFKMLIGSKAQLDFKTKFWKRISPQITAFDYISNEIANFKQLVTASSAFSYRKVNNFSFPITPNMTDTYDALFTFLKHLHSLKMLSFNTVSHINEVEASYVLSSLNYLSHLRALNLNLRGNNSVCVETISESLPQFHALQFLSLQFGKLSTKKVQEMLLRKVAAVTGNLHSVTHLELELYLQKSYTDAFLQFLSGLENLHKLVSLDLRIDRYAASVNEALDLPEVEDSVLKNLKYLTLEGRKQGIGIELVEYFLGKTRNLEACSLTNIELSKPKTGSEEMSELILRNQGLRELRIIYEGEFDAKALEILFQGTKRLEKLQLFLLQLHNPETIAFNVESLIGGITGLQKADTVVIEVAFPLEMKLPMLNRLFDNLHKLKRLCGLKIDLRLASELKGSGVKKLFTNDSFDVFTMTVEGMKLTKEDQKFIKEHTKTMKKLTSVLLECEDFKMDRVF